MQLDVATLAFVTSLLFASQTIAFFVQYRVNKTYKGLGWWLEGTMLQALGFSLILTLSSPSLRILSIFANPLIFSGQIFLYIGIKYFLGKKESRWILFSLFAAYILSYSYFLFIDNSIFGRSVSVSASAAIISAMIAYTLFREEKRQFTGAALFTASVFLAYAVFQAVITVATLLLPRMGTYSDIHQMPIRITAFILPIVGSTLWSFGLIIMVNQRLNAENQEEKEKLRIVLKEVHHRIKNNMSTMISLLNLQAGNMKDAPAAAALEEAGKRLQSMGILYDKLYQSSGFTRLPIRSYLPSLVDEILEGFPGNASLRVEQAIDDFSLDAERLQPLGIIINELLTNTMKYAFEGRDYGIVRVSATLAAGRVAVIVQDNGRGIPESVDIADSTGFGLTLVQALTAQLGGAIRIERGSGTKVVLEFPL